MRCIFGISARLSALLPSHRSEDSAGGAFAAIRCLRSSLRSLTHDCPLRVCRTRALSAAAACCLRCDGRRLGLAAPRPARFFSPGEGAHSFYGPQRPHAQRSREPQPDPDRVGPRLEGAAPPPARKTGPLDAEPLRGAWPRGAETEWLRSRRQAQVAASGRIQRRERGPVGPRKGRAELGAGAGRGGTSGRRRIAIQVHRPARSTLWGRPGRQVRGGRSSECSLAKGLPRATPPPAEACRPP